MILFIPLFESIGNSYRCADLFIQDVNNYVSDFIHFNWMEVVSYLVIWVIFFKEKTNPQFCHFQEKSIQDTN